MKDNELTEEILLRLKYAIPYYQREDKDKDYILYIADMKDLDRAAVSIMKLIRDLTGTGNI